MIPQEAPGGMSKRQKSIKCQEVQLSNTIRFCSGRLCIFFMRTCFHMCVWCVLRSCRSSRSPWSHTQACIYQMTLSCNHFLGVKGKRAVKPKLRLVMSISHCVPIVGLGLEYSSQLPNVISSTYTQIELYDS